MAPLPRRRWWHLAWSLPVAAAVSAPLFAFAALNVGVSPRNVPGSALLVVAIGVCFFAAGLPVRQRTGARRLVVAAAVAVAGVVVTVGALTVVV